MPKASVKRLIDNRKDKLIQFVLDIEKYPEFIPFCDNSKVYERSDNGDTINIIADLTIDLLKNRIIESRLISLSVLLSSSMIFFYNWIFQESRKSKLKRFSLTIFLILVVDSLGLIAYSLFDTSNASNNINVFVSLGLTIAVLLYLMLYKREVTWHNKVYKK